MNEKLNKTREIIEERFVKLHEEVYHQMMNEEKNGYDPEIMLPMCSMMDNIPMKNKYSVISKDDDTFKKMKRREKRLSTLEEHLKNNHSEEAKTIIQKQYCVSITEIAHLAYDICSEKTAMRLIHALFNMIGYNHIKRIPRILVDDILENIRKWIPHTKTVYNCENKPDIMLDEMIAKEMLYTYEFYLIVKKIILIECKSETEYKEKTACLHNVKNRNGVYNVARTIV